LAQTGSLQTLITGIGVVINEFLIPFILALAFLIFVFNAYRFFILGGSTEDGRENAKNLAIYSVIAFTFIAIFWGLVNFFIGTIGLNNDPCENDTISDYIISDLAPCSSPRPRPRPYFPPDTTNPGSGFGTGVGIDDNSIIVPGSGTAPNTSNPPTSFTPGGTPVSYTPVQTAQTAIRTAATPFFSSGINISFGYNGDIVAPLFADLGTTYSNSVTELNRLKAAVRLSELGVIPDALVTTYLNAYNEYARVAGTLPGGPITLASISQDLATTPPAALQSRQNQTRQQVIDTLTLYNANRLDAPAVDINAAISALYNPNTDTETRYDAILELYFPQPGAPLRIDDRANSALLNRFIADINTEKIYEGDFQLAQ
jgi:hypothetical protein